MTPAIKQLKAAGIHHKLHKYQIKEQDEGYGLAAAEALSVDPNQLFKTLVIAKEGEPSTLAVAIVPVSQQLVLKQAAAALGWKKIAMADTSKAQKSTGYVLGGISPLGQKIALPTVLDLSALEFETIYVSAGRRGMQVSINPADLTNILSAIQFHLTGSLT